MFRKIFVPETWARMFSANKIAGFFHNFLHADCDAVFLVRMTLYSISLTFKC